MKKYSIVVILLLFSLFSCTEEDEEYFYKCRQDCESVQDTCEDNCLFSYPDGGIEYENCMDDCTLRFDDCVDHCE